MGGNVQINVRPVQRSRAGSVNGRFWVVAAASRLACAVPSSARTRVRLRPGDDTWPDSTTSTCSAVATAIPVGAARASLNSRLTALVLGIGCRLPDGVRNLGMTPHLIVTGEG